jgi:aminoglycoside 6'-N-acetyltransferase
MDEINDEMGEAGEASRFAFRPLAREDFPMLASWLARPHVQVWWQHDPSSASIEEDFGPGVDGEDAVEYFVVSIDGQESAFIQSCQLCDEDEWWRALQVVNAPRDAFTVDYFIAESSLVGQGLGTAMIGAFLKDRWRRYPDATCSIVDVDPANPPSWRALEKNGYRAVWEGQLDLSDPRDQGTSRVYRLDRPKSTESG